MSCSDEVGSKEWREAAKNVIATYHEMPTLQPIQVIIRDVLRQFNGLGLLTEVKVTVHENVPYSQGTKAVTTDVWRLTAKGQQRLALARGIRRGDDLGNDGMTI